MGRVVARMSTGPIEFIGEESRDEMPNTEYGGTHGLISPEFVDGREAHTVLSAGEVARIQVRYGMRPLVPGHQSTGTVPDGELVRDPRTGRVVDDAASADVTGKPGSGLLSGMGDDVRSEDSDEV